MSRFEYTATPAPIRSEKAKSAKTPAERYALTLTDEINRMAADGWEYLRTETLPSEERSGLTGRTTLFHNLLIFRRPVRVHADDRPAAPALPAAAKAPASTATVSAPGTETAKPQPAEIEKPAETASPVFSEKMRVAEKPGAEKTTIDGNRGDR
ncbi:DUF4177 domain-containing protein [Paracoccus aurantiacus]|uniref:DUF4177 domain-containing protein n=1 Tax=Paracoccus aurantiacus TaxID=2599412 RepID=A0A5C6S931_9RHOB|nr:DUF4177 domain-containing protein [Paracoccus aurantiacus]TXB70884.1 DUF4177 domain-containing protein [Paracoccus aurantiacus]